MVISLKIISSVINYQDGLLKVEDLSEAQKKNRLLKLPSLLEYFGYCLCCGSHFAGPVYEMKDYLEWTERNGVSSYHHCIVVLPKGTIQHCFVSFFYVCELYVSEKYMYIYQMLALTESLCISLQ